MPTSRDGRTARLDFEFISGIIRTDDELTIIAPTPTVPSNTKAQHDFACFRVLGELEFDVVGVIASISHVIAEVQIPILSISTYNTDYFLVPATKQQTARTALKNVGYEFD